MSKLLSCLWGIVWCAPLGALTARFAEFLCWAGMVLSDSFYFEHDALITRIGAIIGAGFGVVFGMTTSVLETTFGAVFAYAFGFASGLLFVSIFIAHDGESGLASLVPVAVACAIGVAIAVLFFNYSAVWKRVRARFAE